MSRQYLRTIYVRVITALMLLLLTFLVGIDYYILNVERQNQLAESTARLEDELDLVAVILVEPLLKFKFAEVEDFIQLWSAKHPNVIRFKAVTPNGLIFTDFQRETASLSRLAAEKEIVFEGRRLMTLTIEKDYAATEVRLIRLRNYSLIASLLMTLLFGVVLWLIFRFLAIRPLEHEIVRRQGAEEELRGINLELEEKVQARTADYKRKNLALLAEVKSRQILEENLSDEKERLAITLRSIADGVITTDVAGGVVMLNKVAENLTGWDQAVAVGRDVKEVFSVSAAQGSRKFSHPVQLALDSGQTVSLDNANITTRDGRQIAVANSSAPILDQKSRTVGAVLVFRDITEKIRTDEELLKMRKLEAVGILAGGIAHDFNNLLTAILGNINLAAQSVPSGDKIHRLLIKAEKASLRATKLTQQLLTMAKGGEPIRETASISQVIKDSADFVLHGGKAELKLEIPDNLWLVDIDRGQVGQVVQNLIINARQAMPEAGIIVISCANIESIRGEDPAPLLPITEKYVRISIADSGVGIPEAIMGKIFDPYFSTKQMGSGLGLSITHSIIRKHGGDITVRSEAGKGTTFNVYLPVSAEKILVEKSLAALPTLPPDTKILVMDDDKLVLEVVGEMLAYLGCEAVFAASGGEAIELFRQARERGRPFDLVILDMTIPGGMGGQEAAAIILKEAPATRLVVASGYSTDPVLANYQHYGFAAAIAKPFRIEELSVIIKDVL